MPRSASGIAPETKSERISSSLKCVKLAPVAVRKCDAALGAALGVDGDPGGAQRVDVAVDRALGDLERLGKGARRPPARIGATAAG